MLLSRVVARAAPAAAQLSRRAVAQPAVRGLAAPATVADVRYAPPPPRTLSAPRAARGRRAAFAAGPSLPRAPRPLADRCRRRARRISCTFIMAKQKQKVTVPGMVGWTLLETAQHHGLLTHCSHADSPWDYSTFGEGPMSAEDHVVVERSFYDKTLPMGYQEKNVLKEVSEDVTPTCARPAPSIRGPLRAAPPARRATHARARATRSSAAPAWRRASSSPRTSTASPSSSPTPTPT